MEIINFNQIQTFVAEYWPHISGISAIAGAGVYTAIYFLHSSPEILDR